MAHLVCFLFTEIAGHVDGPSDGVQSVDDGGHQTPRAMSGYVAMQRGMLSVGLVPYRRVSRVVADYVFTGLHRLLVRALSW